MRKTIREGTRMALGIAAGFGVCYVELAFGEQDFNEEIKLGEMEERSERE